MELVDTLLYLLLLLLLLFLCCRLLLQLFVDAGVFVIAGAIIVVAVASILPLKNHFIFQKLSGIQCDVILKKVSLTDKLK